MINAKSLSHVSLSTLSPGEQAVVVDFKENCEIHCRLRELGLTRGVKVSLKRFAPFGDPMEVIVRGYHLSLRRKDAESILVKKIEPDI